MLCKRKRPRNAVVNRSCPLCKTYCVQCHFSNVTCSVSIICCWMFAQKSYYGKYALFGECWSRYGQQSSLKQWACIFAFAACFRVQIASNLEHDVLLFYVSTQDVSWIPTSICTIAFVTYASVCLQVFSVMSRTFASYSIHIVQTLCYSKISSVVSNHRQRELCKWVQSQVSIKLREV